MKLRKRTKLLMLLGLLLILLLSCDKPISTSNVINNNPLTLLSEDQDLYAQASPDNRITFPDAHFPHKNYRHEWWYLTANLATDSGQRFATQWTLFRTAVSKRHWYFAHAALADTQTHLSAFRNGREEFGNVVFTDIPFSAAIDDWIWQSTAALLPAQLSYGSSDIGLKKRGWKVKLSLSSSKSFYLQGENGYSKKHQHAAIASHYYSQPFIDISGTILWQGKWLAVNGTGWFDREWGSAMLSKEQQGWDWFSLRLSKDLALMIYRIRSHKHDFLYGSLMQGNGKMETIAMEDIKLTSNATNDNGYPQRFTLTLAQQGIELIIAITNDKQVMRFGIEYFEGMVTFSGSHVGKGFVEMTGYR
jgi:predicted secreted hydrolase